MLRIRPISLILIKHKNRLLAQKGYDSYKKQVFYRLLGGEIIFCETSYHCINREIKEELNLSLIDLKLLTVIENIFSYNGTPTHELVFLYSAIIDDTKVFNNTKLYRVDKKDSYAEWISIEEIRNGSITLFPLEAKQFL